MEYMPMIVGFVSWFILVFLWYIKNSSVKEGEQAPSAIIWILGGAFFASWLAWLTDVWIESGFFAFIFMIILTMFLIRLYFLLMSN